MRAGGYSCRACPPPPLAGRNRGDSAAKLNTGSFLELRTDRARAITYTVQQTATRLLHSTRSCRAGRQGEQASRAVSGSSRGAGGGGKASAGCLCGVRVTWMVPTARQARMQAGRQASTDQTASLTSSGTKLWLISCTAGHTRQPRRCTAGSSATSLARAVAQLRWSATTET